MSENKASCGNCKFWSLDGTTYAGDIVGSCLRNPPKLISALYRVSSAEGDNIIALHDATEWPVTCEISVCGEFAERKRQPSQAAPDGIDHLTVKQAAAHIGLSVHTLNAYRQKGNGPPYFGVGGKHVRYDRAELEAWTRSQPRNSTSEN